MALNRPKRPGRARTIHLRHLPNPRGGHPLPLQFERRVVGVRPGASTGLALAASVGPPRESAFEGIRIGAWGDNSVSSCGSHSRAKGPGTSV